MEAQYRITARAIIFDKDDVILIFRRRIKDNKVNEYYAIPGGTQEIGETKEQTVIREIKEELNLDIKLNEYLGTFKSPNAIDYIYSADIISGTLVLGGEEKEHNNKNNYYEIRKININDIDKYNLLDENKKFIKKAYKRREQKDE